MISVDKLIAAGLAAEQARVWASPLSAVASRFQINTPAREASWVSQCHHESGGFLRLEENLFYTTAERVRAMWPRRVSGLGDAATLLRNPQALANRVYSNRNGNGDESSGDGWAYRGRGLLQLTGRANYLAAEAALGQPYKTQPDLVLQPMHAALTAAWFFVAGGCLRLADAGDVDGVTRLINGPAMAGAEARRRGFERALAAFA